MSSDSLSRNVLYVEDEDFDLIFMQTAFRKAGLGESLFRVADGQEAIDYLTGAGSYSDRTRHPLPGVLLLDLNLPLISGFEVLKWLRETSDFKSLPVVVLSSSSREEDKLRAQQLGANEYLEKPASGLHFGKIVDRLKEAWLRE
jgi:CheY-like chemotaxis protein